MIQRMKGFLTSNRNKKTQFRGESAYWEEEFKTNGFTIVALVPADIALSKSTHVSIDCVLMSESDENSVRTFIKIINLIEVEPSTRDNSDVKFNGVILRVKSLNMRMRDGVPIKTALLKCNYEGYSFVMHAVAKSEAICESLESISIGSKVTIVGKLKNFANKTEVLIKEIY